MWKCLCGEVHRDLSSPCGHCGRRISDIAPYAKIIDQIDLAFANAPMATAEDKAFVRRLICEHGSPMSLQEVAYTLERERGPTVMVVVKILNNLDDRVNRVQDADKEKSEQLGSYRKY